jgi:hypothetical protein
VRTSAYYRAEAARCRELAARSDDPDEIQLWQQLAADYEALAQSIASVAQLDPDASEIVRMRTQQQGKTKPDDER